MSKVIYLHCISVISAKKFFSVYHSHSVNQLLNMFFLNSSMLSKYLVWIKTCASDNIIIIHDPFSTKHKINYLQLTYRYTIVTH